MYSPPQARCRAHSHWLLGLSTGDGPTLRVGPPPSASLTAAPPFREAACQRSVAGWGGSMSMRPITTPQPLMGSPALRGRRPTKPPGRRGRAPPGPADPSGTAGDGGKAKRKEPSKRGAPPPECCPAHHPSWGRLRGGLRPFAAPPAGQTHLGWEAPWGASRPLQYSTVATGNVGTVLYSRKNNTGDPVLACSSACQAPQKKGSASGNGTSACSKPVNRSSALLYSSTLSCSTVCPSYSKVRHCSALAKNDGDRRALSPNALRVSSPESHLAKANVQPPAGGGASGPNKALPNSPAPLYSSTPFYSIVCPSCSTVRYGSALAKNDGDRMALSPNALCAGSMESNSTEATVPPAEGGASGPNKALPPVPGYLWVLPLTVLGAVALMAWLVCRPARRSTRLGPKPSPLARLSMAEVVALLLLHPAPSGPLLLVRQGDSHLAFRALRKLGVPLAWVRHSPEGGIAKIRPRLLGGGKNGRGRGRGGSGGSARGGRGGKRGGRGGQKSVSFASPVGAAAASTTAAQPSSTVASSLAGATTGSLNPKQRKVKKGKKKRALSPGASAEPPSFVYVHGAGDLELPQLEETVRSLCTQSGIAAPSHATVLNTGLGTQFYFHFPSNADCVDFTHAHGHFSHKGVKCWAHAHGESTHQTAKKGKANTATEHWVRSNILPPSSTEKDLLRVLALYGKPVRYYLGGDGSFSASFTTSRAANAFEAEPRPVLALGLDPNCATPVYFRRRDPPVVGVAVSEFNLPQTYPERGNGAHILVLGEGCTGLQSGSLAALFAEQDSKVQVYRRPGNAVFEVTFSSVSGATRYYSNELYWVQSGRHRRRLHGLPIKLQVLRQRQDRAKAPALNIVDRTPDSPSCPLRQWLPPRLWRSVDGKCPGNLPELRSPSSLSNLPGFVLRELDAAVKEASSEEDMAFALSSPASLLWLGFQQYGTQLLPEAFAISTASFLQQANRVGAWRVYYRSNLEFASRLRLKTDSPFRTRHFTPPLTALSSYARILADWCLAAATAWGGILRPPCPEGIWERIGYTANEYQAIGSACNYIQNGVASGRIFMLALPVTQVALDYIAHTWGNKCSLQVIQHTAAYVLVEAIPPRGTPTLPNFYQLHALSSASKVVFSEDFTRVDFSHVSPLGIALATWLLTDLGYFCIEASADTGELEFGGVWTRPSPFAAFGCFKGAGYSPKHSLLGPLLEFVDEVMQVESSSGVGRALPVCVPLLVTSFLDSAPPPLEDAFHARGHYEIPSQDAALELLSLGQHMADAAGTEAEAPSADSALDLYGGEEGWGDEYAPTPTPSSSSRSALYKQVAKDLPAAFMPATPPKAAVESESGAASQVATPQVTRDSPTWCALSGTLSLCAETKDGTRVPRDPSHTGSLTEDGLYLLVPMFGSSWDGDPQNLPSCLFAGVQEPDQLRLSIQAGSMLPKIHRVFRLALTSVFPLKRQFPAGDFMSALLLSLMEWTLVGPVVTDDQEWQLSIPDTEAEPLFLPGSISDLFSTTWKSGIFRATVEELNVLLAVKMASQRDTSLSATAEAAVMVLREVWSGVPELPPFHFASPWELMDLCQEATQIKNVWDITFLLQEDSSLIQLYRGMPPRAHQTQAISLHSVDKPRVGDVGLYYVESGDTIPQYTVRVLEHPTSKGYRVQRVDATDKATFDIALTDRRFRIPPILGRIAHVPLNAAAAAAAKVKYDELCAVAAE